MFNQIIQHSAIVDVESDYSPTSPQLNALCANEIDYSPVLPRLNALGEFDDCDLLAVTPSLPKSTSVLSRNNETTSEQNVIVHSTKFIWSTR